MADQNADSGVEAQNNPDGKKPGYPKQVFFIIGNEFCERFSYYGMRAVLTLYFTSKLRFTENVATVVYHAFVMLCYFTPIFGALLSDSFLGKFQTIVYVSLVYILGLLLQTIATISPLHPPEIELSMIGLTFIGIGTGGIKPCVAAFGGDQFKLPEQKAQLQSFFSVFYFSINLGSLVSTLVTPMFKNDVKCFDADTCYPLAFGVPALLMFIATIILVAGKPLYLIKPPEENMIVFGSIGYAVMKKVTGKAGEHDHWLDCAKDKYDPILVDDTKVLLRIFLLYLPLPFFWALFDQQGSRWTLQATRMIGKTGTTTIYPEQMQLVNSALVLIFIPLFDGVIYPVFARCNLLLNPIHRMVVGGILAGLAFIVAAVVELSLEGSYAKIPADGLSTLHLMNSLPCHLKVVLYTDSSPLKHFDVNENLNYIMYDLVEGHYFVRIESDKCGSKDFMVILPPKKVKGIFVLPDQDGNLDIYEDGPNAEDPKKDENSRPKIRILASIGSPDNLTITFSETASCNGPKVTTSVVQNLISESAYISSINPGENDVILDFNETSTIVGTVNVAQGSVSTLVLTKQKDSFKLNKFELTSGNYVHILWQLPQYILLTAGEIMFSITGLEFSYSRAPASLKSVIQAVWLMTVAFGNLIDVLVAGAHSMSQTNEFFMFAGLMVVDMAIFGVLGHWFLKTELAQAKAAQN